MNNFFIRWLIFVKSSEVYESLVSIPQLDIEQVLRWILVLKLSVNQRLRQWEILTMTFKDPWIQDWKLRCFVQILASYWVYIGNNKGCIFPLFGQFGFCIESSLILIKHDLHILIFSCIEPQRFLERSGHILAVELTLSLLSTHICFIMSEIFKCFQ